MTEESLVEPTDPWARRVLDRYLAAFEQSDIAEMERLLADDAILEMTGTRTWFSGKATCAPFIAAQAIGRPGDWRMLPLEANGQLAAAAYHRNDDHEYSAFAVVVALQHIDARDAHKPLRRPGAVHPLRPSHDNARRQSLTGTGWVGGRRRQGHELVGWSRSSMNPGRAGCRPTAPDPRV